ncbi:MAG: DNA repair protein RecO [bacterium]
MFQSTKCIVISKLRYKDNDLIVKCFTEKLGVQSFLIRGIFKSSKRKAFHLAYFGYLSLLEINFDFKKNKSLHFIKDLKVLNTKSLLTTDIQRSSISVFIAEILDSILDNEYSDIQLFELTETLIEELMNEEFTNLIHIVYLVYLSKILGFYPDMTNSNLPNFNLKEGRFTDTSNNEYCISGENLTVLKLVLGTNFDAYTSLIISNANKRAVLEVILLYFKLHLDDFKEPKSLNVLQQVFS